MNIASLKLLLRFNTEYLFEEVSSTYLTVVSDEQSPSTVSELGAPTLLPDGGGYVMEDGKYLLGQGVASNGYRMEIKDQITVGFWLYPVDHGLATSPGGGLESISMPLITLVDSSTHSQVIKFVEHTSDNDGNYLTVEFNGTEYVLTSSGFAAGMWHHVWLTCDRGNDFNIYIDGKEASANKSGDSTTPVGSTHMDLYVNFSQEGYAYNVAKNYGYIDDIFVLNEAASNSKDRQYVINNGIKYLVDSLLSLKLIDGYNIYFNDPTTITINSIVSDMSYVYIGRNDGKILRGSPLFWESRKVYADDNEEEILKLTKEELELNGVKNGFLNLVNTTIRL